MIFGYKLTFCLYENTDVNPWIYWVINFWFLPKYINKKNWTDIDKISISTCFKNAVIIHWAVFRCTYECNKLHKALLVDCWCADRISIDTRSVPSWGWLTSFCYKFITEIWTHAHWHCQWCVLYENLVNKLVIIAKMSKSPKI